MRRRGRLLVVAAVMTALAACATPAVNAKLDRQDPAVGYRYANLTADGDNGEPAHIWKGISPKRSTAKRSGGNDSRPMS